MGQGNKRMEESVVDVRIGVVMSTPRASNTGSSTITRWEYNGNTKLPQIDFPTLEKKDPGNGLGSEEIFSNISSA